MFCSSIASLISSAIADSEFIDSLLDCQSNSLCARNTAISYGPSWQGQQHYYNVWSKGMKSAKCPEKLKEGSVSNLIMLIPSGE